jgi:chromosome segregation protein
MQFDKLRLVGFKSFVDPTEFIIGRGITGVVGPNGCGKSNLVEALRWVMGESSYKSMRGAGMDDVIFAGTTSRPSRNHAEVSLTIDNRNRLAPAAFNDADVLEITRRIEREDGSTYRVNGREVRARDVQLLFADAATGARSPALVRQGQIAEVIAAKPQQRRRLLEDAAGIAGLNARRLESETRLKAADTNLERLDDVLKEIEQQLDGLTRQAKQAQRYRGLSDDIRRLEAKLMHRRFLEARALVLEAERILDDDTKRVAERAEEQARANTSAAVAAHQVPSLREAEVVAAAALQRLASARDALDVEEKRAVSRMGELDARILELAADVARERLLLSDGDGVIARLAAENSTLSNEQAGAVLTEQVARTKADAATQTLAASEAALATIVDMVAEASARRNQLERTIRDASERLMRLSGQIDAVDSDMARVMREISAEADVSGLGEAVQSAKAAFASAEVSGMEAERTLQQARAAEQAARAPLADLESRAQRLETEAKTLAGVIAKGTSGAKYPPVLEHVRAAKGFERAVGAALGEDLDASLDPRAPMRWAGVAALENDPALPPGVEALSVHVTAPPALSRGLAQVGLVTRERGPELARVLAPGQILVSVEGDLWRWDGLFAAADAPSAAARKLAEKNRLSDVEREAGEARQMAETARRQFAALQIATVQAAKAEDTTRAVWKTAQRSLAEAQERLAAAERRVSAANARLSAFEEAKVRLGASLTEAGEVKADAIRALEAVPDISALEIDLAEARAGVTLDRAGLAEARANLQTLQREADMRSRRLEAISSERQSWIERRERAEGQISMIGERSAEAQSERARLDGLPGLIREKRLSLLGEVDAAQARRRAAADALAAGEVALAEADRTAKATLVALSEAREARARTEVRLDAARERRVEVERRSIETLDLSAQELPQAYGFDPAKSDEDPAVLEARLEGLRRDRERLGGVNLRADEEAVEIATRRDALVAERTDLEEAIRRLRTGIQSLNREGRERLLAAFAVVDGHFRRLFRALFGGGTAELTLTDSEDPLEAGLDILAHPPGKKPQTLSLLSGGEQALTAMALIFAVFLTNPSPICVLDEVDAPLDDHNVERFCDLLDEMAASTNTRFVVITHNPISMARVHRLFGVTMVERGVSQLVSVDLEVANRLVEAA